MEKIINIDELKGRKILIYGANAVAEVLIKILKKNNIDILGVFDDSINKQNRIMDGFQILPFSSICKKIPIGTLVALTMPQVEKILKRLEKLDKKYQIVMGALLLEKRDIIEFDWGDEKDVSLRIIETAILCQKKYLKPNGMFFRSVDLVVTERCSLKCRDCANLMQYYEEPKDIPLTLLRRSVDVLSDLVDEINEVRVLGGEPFMHRELADILWYLIEKKNINAVVVYTNGTILPKVMEYSKFSYNKKLLFSITDYGKLSRNILGMQKLLEKLHIKFYKHKVGGWTSCSSIRCHHRTSDQLRDLFQECCVNDVTTLLKGKLYRCPFMANAMNLSAIPESSNDYVDLLSGNCMDDICSKVQLLMNNQRSFSSCDFCDGRFLEAPLIDPAIQIKEPKYYKEYRS